MQFEEIKRVILQKLEDESPSYMTYHNAAHTIDVMEAATYIAQKEGITGDDLILLKTAALFHDIGYLQSPLNHEQRSCNKAKEILPKYGYSHARIAVICDAIMATRIPQTPRDKLGEVLCDADLFYLGGNEYGKRSELLFQEFKREGTIKTYAEWELLQINFLSSHSFFTETAIHERQKTKLEYLSQLLGKRSNLLIKSKRVSAKEITEDILFNVVGVIIASIALKFFLVPNQFFDGGITGLSLLVHEMYHINLSLLIIAFNIPLIIMGYYILGMHFSLRILISVVLFGICLHFIPVMAVTQDKLLTAAFGGVFLGLGVGLVMRAGAALDGMEVVALYTLKRTAFTITEIILGFNILIFSVAAFAFGIETALYSILTYFAATRTIDYVVEGIRAYMGVTIVSSKSEAIKYEIVNNMGRGITVYRGVRGFLPGNFTESSEVDIVFTIITRMEIRKLKNLVYEIDPKAFIFASTIKDASGGILTRRHVH